MALDDRTPQEIGALFGAQMMGGTIGTGPPAPGSRLARVLLADQQLASGAISRQDHDRVLREVRLEIKEQIAADAHDDQAGTVG